MNYPMQSSGLAGLNTVQNMSDQNMAQTLMANGGQRFSRGGISNIRRMAEGGLPKYKYDALTGKYTQVDDIVSSVTDDSLPKYTYDPITQRYTLDTSSVKKKDEDSEAVSDGGPGDAPPPPGPGGGVPGGGGTNPGFFSTVMNVVAGLMGHPTGLQDPAPVSDAGTSAVAAQQEALAQSQNQALNQMSGRQETQMNEGPNQGGLAESGHSSSFDSSTDSETGNTPGGGGAESEARGGLNLNGRYYPPKYAQGGLFALARGGISNLGDYSDGGRLLRGPGDGVSDGIPAIIANKQPARLADGEFVVPARIVSELGNGSTEAGARKLYQMLARVQNARKKSIGQGRVAVNSRSDKMLPA